MKLNGLIFSHFYSEVTNYIHLNELTGKQREKIKVDGSALWFTRQFGNERGKFIYQLYLPKGTDEDYLIKKKSSLKPDSANEEDVADNVIIHCLETKLKRAFPKEIPKENANIARIRAKVLMQFFIKKNLPILYSANKDFYEVYNENDKTLIFENLNRKKPKSLTSQKKINIVVDGDNEPVIVEGNSNNNRVQKLIGLKNPKNKFEHDYKSNCISIEKRLKDFFMSFVFEEMDNNFDYWWSENIIGRWQNSRSDYIMWFTKEVYRTISVEHVHVWNIRFNFDNQDQVKATCNVFLSQLILDMPTMYFHPLHKITANEQETLCKILLTIHKVENDLVHIVYLFDENGTYESTLGSTMHGYQNAWIGRLFFNKGYVKIIESNIPLPNNEFIPIKKEFKVFEVGLKLKRESWHISDISLMPNQ